MLFLLNWRVTIITLTAIPLSILATFIVFQVMGQSVNTMTLGGIAIAVGELVDDAVVGVENALRRLRENAILPTPRPRLEVVREVTMEVRGPILIGTAIVLLVFVPLFFLPGLPGRLFAPLAQAYIISILASMLVSLTVTPVLAYALIKPKPRSAAAAASDAGEHDGPVLRFCKELAARAYALTLGRAWAVLGVCAVLVAVSVVVVTRIGSEFLPPFNEGTAVISISSAPGVSLTNSDALGRAAERLALEVPEVKSVARRTGRAENDEHALGVNNTELEVDFFEPGEGPVAAYTGAPQRTPPAKLRSRQAVFKDLRERLTELPGVSVSVGQPIGHRIDHLESGVQAQIVVKIYGPDLGTLRQIAEQCQARLAPIKGVVDLNIEPQVLVPQVHVETQADRAALFGFTSAQVVAAVETALGGREATRVLEGNRSVGVIVTLNDAWRAPEGDLEKLGQVRLISPTGAVCLLSDVADIREQLGPSQVSRENTQRRIYVACNVEGRSLGEVVQDISTAIAPASGWKLPEGYVVQLEGQFQAQRRATLAIGILGGISLIVMLALLWSHFGSGVMAAQVMLNIPFAFIGAAAALVIAGVPFSIASLIGFISLCGISARNGVLMISHYLHLLVAEKAPFDRATIIRGSQERVAPVLMTALTTGLAVVPLLIHPDAPGREILYPVAVVIMGGLVTTTLLDFFVTPTVFLRFAGPAAKRLVAQAPTHSA